MIRYRLTCDQGHAFESWFASAAAFDVLLKGGHLACTQCGSAQVDKALMAPSVASAAPPARPLATPSTALEQKIAELRRQVEENSDYVGADFAAEARAIHLGEAPDRAIWGEAHIDDARALADEGVPVAPLPFFGKSRGN